MVDDTWIRLGDYLTHRRVELSNSSRLAEFLRQRGASKFLRIAEDLEKGVRDNYDRGSLAQAEIIYEWLPGSIRAVLSGGSPMPVERDATPAPKAASE